MPLSVDGRWGRFVQRIASSAWFGKVMPRILPPVDRLLHRLTGGRVLISQLLVPTLVLTTTGRRSGEPRDVPLACVAEADDTFVVVGSNFGQAHHPAWTGNLLANADAVVSVGGKAEPVRAVLADGADREHLLEVLARVWPAYRTYQRRAAGRELRVFRLHPRDA